VKNKFYQIGQGNKVTITRVQLLPNIFTKSTICHTIALKIKESNAVIKHYENIVDNGKVITKQ